MPNTYFQFKQFRIEQDQCAMKVGTDGVLLGLLSEVGNAKTILDVGTGTGLVALMLAQKYKAEIYAIEIESNAAKQAKENFSLSPWANNLHLIPKSLLDFSLSDLGISAVNQIICNPPYFKNSVKTASNSRTLARQTDGNFIHELVEFSSKFLSNNGLLTLIFPVNNLEEYLSITEKQGLNIIKQINIKSHPDSEIIRVLITFSKNKLTPATTYFTIYEKDRTYSTEFKTAAKDYFLNF